MTYLSVVPKCKRCGVVLGGSGCPVRYYYWDSHEGFCLTHWLEDVIRMLEKMGDGDETVALSA